MTIRAARFFVGVVTALMFFGGVGVVQASGLTTSQVSAIISLLQSFGADQGVVANVSANLGGSVGPKTYTGAGAASAGASSAVQSSAVVISPLIFSVSPAFESQSYPAGSVGVLVAQFDLDATHSGEDLSLSKFAPLYANSSIDSHPTNCQLFDGAVALSTGQNILKSPTSPASGYSYIAMYLDKSLIIPKGTIKTLDIRCDIPITATPGSFQWGTGVGSGAFFSLTGVTSGQTVNPTKLKNDYGFGIDVLIQPAPNSVTVSDDISAPSVQTYNPGQAGVILGVYNFRATGESALLSKVGFRLASGKYSDISKISLYTGPGDPIATVVPLNSGTVVAIPSRPFVLPKDIDVHILVKGDIAPLGSVSQPGSALGDLIKLSVVATTTQATGQSSGVVFRTTSDTNAAGVRVGVVSIGEPYASAVGKILPSLVSVMHAGSPTAGTGVIIRSDGYVLTAGHVAPNGLSYTVVLPSGIQKQAKFIYADPVYDVAILKIDGTGYPAVVLGDTTTLQSGQQIASAGYILGNYNNLLVVTGSASFDATYLGISAAIQSGMSGGPMIDMSGRVIAINRSTTFGTSQGVLISNALNAIRIAESATTLTDTQRASRIVELEKAIEAYRVANGVYPPWDNASGSLTVLTAALAPYGGTVSSDLVVEGDQYVSYGGSSYAFLVHVDTGGSAAGQCRSGRGYTGSGWWGEPPALPDCSFQPPTTAPLGVLQVFANNETTPASTNSGITQAAALTQCQTNAPANTWAMRCVWNGNEIFNNSNTKTNTISLYENNVLVSAPSALMGPFLLQNAVSQCTQYAQTRSSVSVRCEWGGEVIFTANATPAPVTGTLQVFANYETTPASTNSGITQAAALTQCQTNAPANTWAMRCVWNGNEIFNNSNTKTSTLKIYPGTSTTAAVLTVPNLLLPNALSQCKQYIAAHPSGTLTCVWDADEDTIFVSGATSMTPITHTLAKGWTGPEVTTLQSTLTKLGLFKEEVTGYFGQITENAVKAFQQANNLAAVGEVGPQTRELLGRFSK